MPNLLDYISWRGDLSLTRDGFNEADAAVLARFAYIPFEGFAQPLPAEFRPIRSFAAAALAEGGLMGSARWETQDDKLLAAMADSERFGGMEVGRPVCLLDEILQTQFSAITVKLQEDLYYIAFRGTDNTLVGWKEDMNMSFLCPIPGQEMAADYVRRRAECLPGRLILGGHSKGGNLAVYAAAFCGGAAQERIEAVYNFDGPGFFDDILQKEDYRRVCARIKTYIPQFSVVGMLLNREERQTVVHSVEIGIMQHDLYSWELLGPGFIHLEQVTKGSRFVDATIKDWISDMTPEQFEKFADAIYAVLSSSNARSIRDLKENWLESAKGIVHSLGDMDESTRTVVLETLRLLAQSAGHEAKATILLPEHQEHRLETD